MPKRAEVSGEEEVATDTEASATTILVGVDVDSAGVASTETLLGLGSFFICLEGTSSVTVALTEAETAGVVDSAEVAAEEVLDVLTILSDYTHISSVFLSSFEYILYIAILYFIIAQNSMIINVIKINSV